VLINRDELARKVLEGEITCLEDLQWAVSQKLCKRSWLMIQQR